MRNLRYVNFGAENSDAKIPIDENSAGENIAGENYDIGKFRSTKIALCLYAACSKEEPLHSC